MLLKELEDMIHDNKVHNIQNPIFEFLTKFRYYLFN